MCPVPAPRGLAACSAVEFGRKGPCCLSIARAFLELEQSVKGRLIGGYNQPIYRQAHQSQG